MLGLPVAAVVRLLTAPNSFGTPWVIGAIGMMCGLGLGLSGYTVKRRETK
jgi:hypothetical protein